jgi:hypothetical protein
MKTTRLTSEEALAVTVHDAYTANHVLVINENRLKFQPNMRGEIRPFYRPEHSTGFFDLDELKALYRAGAILELETPSPFDDEAFKGWNEAGSPTSRVICGKSSKVSIWSEGGVFLEGMRFTTVPKDKIPEAARLINALLALGEK